MEIPRFGKKEFGFVIALLALGTSYNLVRQSQLPKLVASDDKLELYASCMEGESFTNLVSVDENWHTRQGEWYIENGKRIPYLIRANESTLQNEARRRGEHHKGKLSPSISPDAEFGVFYDIGASTLAIASEESDFKLNYWMHAISGVLFCPTHVFRNLRNEEYFDQRPNYDVPLPSNHRSNL